MKICINCGKELVNEAKFCSECGESTENTAKFCQNCGNALEKGAKFCINCGASTSCLEEKAPQNSMQEPLDSEEPKESAFSATEANEEPRVSVKAPINTKQNEQKEPKKPVNNRTNCILSFSFAIPALVCAILCGTDALEAIFLFLPSVFVLFALSRKFMFEYYKNTDKENGYIKASKILTRIALPVGVVVTCLTVITGIVSFVYSPEFKGFFEELMVFIDEYINEFDVDFLHELGISK